MSDPKMKLGRCCYEIYVRHLNAKPWSDVLPEEQRAWARVANAVAVLTAEQLDVIEAARTYDKNPSSENLDHLKAAVATLDPPVPTVAEQLRGYAKNMDRDAYFVQLLRTAADQLEALEKK